MTALITGASKGIGKEFVIEFAKNKIDVIMVARSQKLLHEHAQFVEKKFKRAVTINRSRYETNKHNFLLIPRIDMGKNLSIFKIFLKTETFYEDIKYKQNELYL